MDVIMEEILDSEGRYKIWVRGVLEGEKEGEKGSNEKVYFFEMKMRVYRLNG